MWTPIFVKKEGHPALLGNSTLTQTHVGVSKCKAKHLTLHLRDLGGKRCFVNRHSIHTSLKWAEAKAISTVSLPLLSDTRWLSTDSSTPTGRLSQPKTQPLLSPQKHMTLIIQLCSDKILENSAGMVSETRSHLERKTLPSSSASWCWDLMTNVWKINRVIWKLPHLQN